MCTVTSSGRDRGGTDVVSITCPACGYFEEHFIGRGLAKSGGGATGAGDNTPSHTSGELAPRGLTLQDQRRIRTALASSTSANTRRAYDQAWRRFVVWAEARRTPALPATPELAAAFLAELAEEGLSVATLRLQKAALAKVHRSAGHQDPTENEG